MKRLIIASTFTTLALNAATQEPRKKDSHFIITVTDTLNLMTRVTTVLFDSGYQPDFTDDKAKLIVTREKDFSTYTVRLRLKITGPTITMTGEGRFWSLFKNDKADSYDPITYTGMKGSQAKDSWNEVDKVAKLLGSVRYSK